MSAIKVAQNQATFRIEGLRSARDTIGELSAGCRVIGITKGQFSLLDLIRAVLEQTGPADVLISTWTTGIRDAENANFLIQEGHMTSFRMLTDRSFVTRQPKYVARILEIFGPESIRCTKTHAKFAIIRNDKWNIAIRSSMNLNRNPRWEQFDLDDSAEISDFFTSLYDEIAETTPAGLIVESARVDAVFTESFGGPKVVEKAKPVETGPFDLEAMLARNAAAVDQALGRIAKANEEIDEIKRARE